MPTNQEYYGLESEWVQPNAANIVGTNRTNQWLTAYFGPGYNIGSVTYNAGSLASGLRNGKIPKGQQLTDGYMIDDPIDTSLSYCGLGNESVYSNIAYLEYKTGMCGNSFTAAEDRSVTNFAFCQTQGSDNGFYIYNDSSTSGASSINGSRSRFAPYGINGEETSITRANRNRPVTPYAQIPVRNTVFYPILRVAANIQENPKSVSGMNIVNVDWEDYMNLQNSVNYTTHPYILRITMQAYTTRYVDDIDAVTGVPENDRNAMGSSLLSGVAVLSPSNVADGEPMDIANPTQNLTDIYTYYNTRSKFATNSGGVMLFGYTSVGLNENDYINEPAPNVSVNSSSQRLVFFPHPDAVLREAANNTNTSTSGWYYLEYYDDLVDWVMEQIACFGLFFTLDKATAQRGALNDDLMFLGVLENGIGHGKWTSGEDNEDQPQWEWDTTNKSSYKPSEGGGGDDPNEYDEENRSVLRNPLYAQVGGHTYITSGNNFVTAYKAVTDRLRENFNVSRRYADALSNAITAYEADPSSSNYEEVEKARTILDSGTNIEKMYGQGYAGIHTNPVDSVKSILAFPFDLRNYISSEAKTNMQWGLWSAPLPGIGSGSYNLVSGTTSQFWVPGGTCTYFAEYENFLDYAPYCSAELYIPYCGSVNIDPETFIGHDITVRYLVDWHTGACLALVYRDSLIVEQISGQMGILIPMIAADELSYANSMFQGQQAVKNAQTASVATTASGLANGFTQGVKMATVPLPTNIASGLASITQSAAAIATSYNNVKSAQYELATKQLSYKQITTATPMTSTGNEQECRLVIYRPIFLDENTKNNFGTYGHTTGFACLKNDKLSNYSGLTVCSSVDLSGIGKATEKEKEMIEKALRSGVYL